MIGTIGVLSWTKSELMLPVIIKLSFVICSRRCLQQTEFARKIGNAHLMTPDVVDLIERLLTLDPTRRWSANKVRACSCYWKEVSVTAPADS